MGYLVCVVAVALLAFAAWKVFSGDRKVESKNTKIVIVGMERSAKFGRCQGSAHDAETMRGILPSRAAGRRTGWTNTCACTTGR